MAVVTVRLSLAEPAPLPTRSRIARELRRCLIIDFGGVRNRKQAAMTNDGGTV